ncbi:MAG: hypothetical protein QXV69_01700 [Sulfolobaceae archaeon]
MRKKDIISLLTDIRIFRNRIRNNIYKINNRLNNLNINVFEKERKQLSLLLYKLNIIDLLLEIIELRLEIYIELGIFIVPYLYSAIKVTKDMVKDFQLPEVILILEELEESLPQISIPETILGNKFFKESKENLEKLINQKKESIVT